MTQRIGILGGTFDPVHNGHVILAIESREQLRLDRLLVVPARQSPHKTSCSAAPAEVRISLLRLAFAGVPGIEVSDLEIRRPAPSFTVDTIAEVASVHPGADIVLLLGWDALADFPRWRDVATIVQACRLAVFRRPGRDASVIDDARRAVPGLRIDALDTPMIEISSTRIRERARAGLPLSGWVPDTVRKDIEARRLYGAP